MVEKARTGQAPATRKGLGLSADMMAPPPGVPASEARTTQTTTMPREFYYGTVVPYLAGRAKRGLPATWNWLSVEAVRRYIEEDADAPAPPGGVPDVRHPPDRRHRTLEHGGVERTVSEWARETGIPKHKIIDRMDRLWPSWRVLGLEPPAGEGGDAARAPGRRSAAGGGSA